MSQAGPGKPLPVGPLQAMLAENPVPSALTASFNCRRPHQKRSLISVTRKFKHYQAGAGAPSGPPLALSPDPAL